MIIDLLNFCHHSTGAEAGVLFRLQESGIRVPSFFCLTEDFTEDELNNYLQNHFQHTTHFTIRLSLSYEDGDSGEITIPEYEPPHYINIQKSIIVRYAERLFEEARYYIESHYPGSVTSAHVIVQEMLHATIFGGMQTACRDGALNETMITIGTGHNTDFIERGVPFSIYCHNDTDNILFAYEAEGAMTAPKDLIEKLLEVSDMMKAMFSNYHLSVKFIADYDEKKLYMISVQKIVDMSDSPEDEIILDTKGMCRYYPSVTKPLHASIAMMLSRKLFAETFSRISRHDDIPPEFIEQIAYVNGRLYSHTKRLDKLQKLLSFHEDTEEFLRPSLRTFLKHIKSKNGFSRLRKQRDIAVKLVKLLEDNLKRRNEICAKLSSQYQEYSEAGSGSGHSNQRIHNIFDCIINSLSECMCSNLFNTLYINMNKRAMSRMKPADRKYARSAEMINQAEMFRKELRVYHSKFMELLCRYGLRTGEAFCSIGALEKAEDIFMLTYDETLALKDGNLKNARELVVKRSKDFVWYKSLPSFSRLVFYKEIQSAPAGTVHFLDIIKDSCYIRGSGLTDGAAKLPVIVCEDSCIPENCSKNYIYAVPELPESIPSGSIGGLIIEEPAVFAELDLGCPVISGAEHICTLAAGGRTAEINGSTGDITVFRRKDINI